MPAPPTVPRPAALPWELAFLVGIPLVAAGVVVLTGSFSNAAVLVFLSVLCTAGIGSIFWLGLSFVVGLATLYSLDQLLRWRGHPRGLGVFAPPIGAPGKQQRQRVLEHYVARRLAQGGDPARVRQELLQAGWGEPQLQQAFLTLGRR